MRKKNDQLNDNGFTLIEVIISIAIFGIIFVSFLTLFHFSTIGILRARDKTFATSIAQGSIEEQIAVGNGYQSQIKIEFPSNTLIIPGAKVEVNTNSGISNSYVEGFVPFVPTIDIDPRTAVEGHSIPVIITIKGTDTNFSNNTKVSIYNREQNDILYSPVFNYINPKLGYVSLSNHLVNENGDYIISLKTILPDGSVEILRAKFTVFMPNLIAVSEKSIYVSDDGNHWYERTSDTNYPTPNLDYLSDVVFMNGEYIAIGGTSVVRLRDFRPWTKNQVFGTSKITGISYSNGTYYICTIDGLILKSIDGSIWTTMYSNPSTSLFDLHVTGDGKVVAVGEGIILSGNSFGDFISITTGLDGIKLNSVTSNSTYNEITNTWSHQFVVVGEDSISGNGYALKSIDSFAWSTFMPASPIRGLNEVFFVDSQAGYIGPSWLAVGDSGTFLTSVDLSNWNVIPMSVYGDINLNSVHVSNNKVYIVGNEGIILKSGENDISNFISIEVGTENFNSITGR